MFSKIHNLIYCFLKHIIFLKNIKVIMFDIEVCDFNYFVSFPGTCAMLLIMVWEPYLRILSIPLMLRYLPSPFNLRN